MKLKKEESELNELIKDKEENRGILEHEKPLVTKATNEVTKLSIEAKAMKEEL